MNIWSQWNERQKRNNNDSVNEMPATSFLRKKIGNLNEFTDSQPRSYSNTEEIVLNNTREQWTQTMLIMRHKKTLTNQLCTVSFLSSFFWCKTKQICLRFQRWKESRKKKTLCVWKNIFEKESIFLFSLHLSLFTDVLDDLSKYFVCVILSNDTQSFQSASIE